MTTDFSYGGKTINSSGPIKPSGENQPLDARTEVKLYADIESIPNPYVGMIITVLKDETNSNKMTDYKVLSLKANSLGVANSIVDQIQRYVDYLGARGVSQDDINTAVNNYLRDNPIQSGATTEQVAQIQANKTAIGDANSGLIKKVNDIKNTELQNLNTAIQTLETLVGVDETLGDKSGLPSGDANVIASINRIDSKTSETVTDEQISTAVNNYLTEHPVTGGATTEQAAQIQANTAAIGDTNSGLTKEVNDIKNIELRNLNSSIQTLETLMNSDNPLKKNLFFKSNKKAGKGCVVFITDDGHECDLNFREVFNKYNKKFCSAVIAGWVGTTKTDLSIGNGRYMNWEEIQTLQSEGHEILSHTFSHKGLDNNNEQDIKDITDALNEFKSHNINAESIVFPYNRASDTVKREILNYHRAGIGGTITTIQNKIPLNHKYYLRRVEARGSAGEDYTTNYSNNTILEAINNNELLIFMLHSHFEPQEKQAELVEAMIKFCINNNVDICTMSEALDRFENVIQLGGGFEDESSYWCLAPNKRVYTVAPVDVESLSLNKNIANVNLSETLTLIATITPDNASNKNVTWLSSNPEVATVVNGTVTALTLGECVITCTSEENSLINAKCTINVVENGETSSDTILLDNAIMWLDARDDLKAINGKWTIADRIDNSKYLTIGNINPTLHENGALIMTATGTSDLYNGTVDISKRNLTFFVNFKKDTAVTNTTNLINLYDKNTAGSFIKTNQTTEGLGIQIYTTWNKVHEVAIPEFSISNNCSLVIRLNGNTLTVNYNGNVYESTSETLINNFSQMAISFDKSSTFYSMYLYNTALTDEQIQTNINYEKTVNRG